MEFNGSQEKRFAFLSLYHFTSKKYQLQIMMMVTTGIHYSLFRVHSNGTRIHYSLFSPNLLIYLHNNIHYSLYSELEIVNY